jgi:DNA (cytosine-5)-methyltransferase 1
LGNGGGGGAKTGLYCLPTYCVVGNTIDRSYKSGGNGTGINEEVSYTLTTIDRHAVTVPFIRNAFGGYIKGDVAKTLLARDDITSGDLIASFYSVRRLTPLECERLQGYPDGWTEFGHDGRRISENQRYKALGNSIAVPCVVFVLSRAKK